MMKFTFRNKEYEYFDHPGNQTAVNERRVELPIAFEFIEKYKDVLEIGNVTRHYHREWKHDVVDLNENPTWPIWNKDVLTFEPPRKYLATLSISTVEHTVNPVLAVERIIKFAPKYLITMPIGYSSNNGVLNLDYPMYFMIRKNKENEWEQMFDKNSFREIKYGKPFPYANGVVIITNEKA